MRDAGPAVTGDVCFILGCGVFGRIDVLAS